MKKLLLLGIVIAGSLFTGCDKGEEPVTPDPLKPVISDENFYWALSRTVVHCQIDMYNQNIAGKLTGDKNITAPGPLGGTVTITGRTNYNSSTGIQSVDLVFDMQEVKYNWTSSDYKWTSEITQTGKIAYRGTYSTSYYATTYQSDDLHISGIVTYTSGEQVVSRKIDERGSLNINRSNNKFSVDMFDHVTYW